ncbi:hypothetical protein FNV43_RR21643 [Rhamnella rubrinervis]|uniref:Uncharacterized protein n=1 Tax=Rhamnella rubrinervis TaxID=2594499 RepID=A0A8K0DSU6_9ROSA|nr:hypothetical protein FNV43_RR21643 [Rhamnella rubrinervis]
MSSATAKNANVTRYWIQPTPFNTIFLDHASKKFGMYRVIPLPLAISFNGFASVHPAIKNEIDFQIYEEVKTLQPFLKLRTTTPNSQLGPISTMFPSSSTSISNLALGTTIVDNLTLFHTITHVQENLTPSSSANLDATLLVSTAMSGVMESMKGILTCSMVALKSLEFGKLALVCKLACWSWNCVFSIWSCGGQVWLELWHGGCFGLVPLIPQLLHHHKVFPLASYFLKLWLVSVQHVFTQAWVLQ